ncbi:MAG: hypothetical protein ACOC2W_01020 [bacterium]
MNSLERELDIINNKINNDDRLIREYQYNGISEKKINKIKILKEKHLSQKAKIEEKMQ